MSETRDRIACAISNFALNHIATKGYRDKIAMLIGLGMAAAKDSAAPPGGDCLEPGGGEIDRGPVEDQSREQSRERLMGWSPEIHEAELRRTQKIGQRAWSYGDRVKVASLRQFAAGGRTTLVGRAGTVVDHAAFPVGEFTVAVALDGDDGVRAFRSDELQSEHGDRPLREQGDE